MHLLGSLLSIIFAVGLALFALLNLQSVEITWSPFHAQTTMPLYLICAISAVFGFVIGSTATWIYGANTRKTKREQKKKIKELEKKLGKIQGHVSKDDLKQKAPLISIGK